MRRRVPGRRVPGEGQVWALETDPPHPQATPSPPASVAPSPFPPPTDPPWPSRPRPQLPVPSPTRHAPPLFPAPVAPSALPFGGKWAGWGALSFRGGASGDPSAQTIVDARGVGHLRPHYARNAPPPCWLLSSLHSGFPREPGSGVGLIRPRLPRDTPPLGARSGLASCCSPQKRRRVSARRRSTRFLFLPRESARRTHPGRAAAPGGPAQRFTFKVESPAVLIVI